MRPALSDPPALPVRLARDSLAALRFYSRLPAPRLAFEGDPFAAPDFAALPQVLPLVALVIAAPGALALALGAALGLPDAASAALCLAASALATGCFHEDGLADAADGLGGGATREARLTIMKDSRVGTFGASALALSFLLRAAALAGVSASLGAGAAVAAWLIAAALARLIGLAPLFLLEPARAAGLAALAQRPAAGPLARGALLALVVAALGAMAGGLSFAALLAGLVGAAAATGALVAIARRLIGGQTGDIAGAAEQLAEIALLLAFSATLFQ
jgi:adenosylcobinamide-GDP ribazoletransferase